MMCVCTLFTILDNKESEPVREKTNNLCFGPGQTQTDLYRWLEAGNFECRKKRNCTIHVAKTNLLRS